VQFNLVCCVKEKFREIVIYRILFAVEKTGMMTNEGRKNNG